MCSDDLEALPIWCKMLNLYGSQEFKVHLHSEGVELRTAALAGTFEGLYTLQIKYRPRKANVVTDTLSRKPKGMVGSLLTTNPQLLRELETLQIKVILPGERSQLAALHITSSMVDNIKEH